MKTRKIYAPLLFAAVASVCLTACHNPSDREKMEMREEKKVGQVYNRDVQGPDVENHKNQFYISRMDTKDTTTVQEVTMSTATAATDTTATAEVNN